VATLYLDRKGLDLDVENGVLILREGGERVRSVPLTFLDRVVIRAEVSLTSSVLGELARAGAETIVLSGRHGKKMARIDGIRHNDVRIRLRQYALFHDATLRRLWAGRLVSSKLKSQARALRTILRVRPDLTSSLLRPIEQILELTKKIRPTSGESPDLPTLLGMEGGAGSIYFEALTSAFASSLRFTGRNRRPPRDPVNAVLSLSYTLLHFDAVRTANMCGLDPMIGFFHEPAYGRDSLACDLIEPLRSRVDIFAWDLFRSRSLRDDHFVSDKGACLLGKTGRQYFYPQYEILARTWRRQLLRESRLLVSAIREGFSEEFEDESDDPSAEDSDEVTLR